MPTEIAFVLAVSVILGSSMPGRDDAVLVAAAETYCFVADGNTGRTWDRVEADGFQALAPEDFPNLRLPGARNLRGYTRMIDGVELRVLTAETRFDGFNQGENFFRMCWVSAQPADRRRVDAELRRTLHVEHFRQGDAFVYAWANTEDGRQRPVNRREFVDRGFRDALAQDMRFVLTNEYRGQVSITYMVPTDGFSEPRITRRLGGSEVP